MIFLRISQTLSFWTARSASWTAQNWLDSTVRICMPWRKLSAAFPIFPPQASIVVTSPSTDILIHQHKYENDQSENEHLTF